MTPAKFVCLRQDASVFARGLEDENKKMQHKTFEHKEIEQCSLSKKSIDTLKERYSVILDCEGEQIKKIKFYKTDLLKDLIKEKGEKVIEMLKQNMQDMAGGMAGNVLAKMGLIKPQFEVK